MGGYRIGEKNRAEIEKDPQLRCLICLHCGYLSKDPTVLTCGHRLCRTCIEISCVSGSSVCPIDGHDVNLDECHQDKHATVQINALDMSCEVEICHWHGRVWQLEDHMKEFHNGHKEEGAKTMHQDGELERLRQEQQAVARKIMGFEETLGKQGLTINNLQQQLSAFCDAFVKTQGHGQLDKEEIVTRSNEMRQELVTLRNEVQTLKNQFEVQKDQCGKYHDECWAESGRAIEERNIEVEILKGSITCLEKGLVDLRNRHTDLQNSYAALQTRHADLENRHDTLRAQVRHSEGSS